MNEKTIMINDMVGKLALLLIKRDKNLSIQQALQIVFNSETYLKLIDEKTTLYYQSPKYVFSFLQEELNSKNL
ncbi:MAG: hypothetical protein IJ180_02495 [Bacteroidales bacterium]|nr:hypothetical protein [Bacteroidales bacterium]